MRLIAMNDLMNIYEYEKQRVDYRKSIIEYKKDRRILLGDKISIVFENRKTLIFQVLEMMRAERMVDDSAIQHEIDVYNSLIPSENELSATLFIEITEESDIKRDLHQFIGLTDGDKLWLEFGDHKIFAEFEEGRSEEDKISSVHYIRFTFNDKQKTDFIQTAVPSFLHISHSDYVFAAEMSTGMYQSLIEDLVVSRN